MLFLNIITGNVKTIITFDYDFCGLSVIDVETIEKSQIVTKATSIALKPIDIQLDCEL